MRRISAHYIFPIVTPPLRNGIITLSDEGVILDITEGGSSIVESDGVEFYSGIIAPAFVNAHCHLELSYMRQKIKRGTGLADFIRQVSAERQRNAADMQRIAAAARYADARMYHSGIAAAADISNSSDSFETKQKSRIVYHTFVEKYGLLPQQKSAVQQQAQQILCVAQQAGLSASITPHAPYSVCPDILQSLAEMGGRYGALSIHHQESQEEQKLFEMGDGTLAAQFQAMGLTLPPRNGRHSLQYLSQHIPRSTRLLMVHNTFMTEEQYDFAASHWSNITWVLCPQSNLYIENTLPPVEMLRRKKAFIALGTDSFASHPSLLMIDDLIVLHRHFPHIPMQELLTWATINGASAMRMEHQFGGIAIGKKSGLAWIQGADLSALRFTPRSTMQRIA